MNPELPSLTRLAAALREVTEVLAFEIRAPTNEPPPWGEFEWRIARAVASMQGVSSVLSEGLCWQRPEAWRRFLRDQRGHVAGRHRKMADLLAKIDAAAHRAGIALVALKGAALHASGIYVAGERPMADLDLLVRDADVEATTRLLQGLGFDLTLTTWRNWLFEPPHTTDPHGVSFGENIDSPIKIEVHAAIRERLPIIETDITEFVFPSSAHAGINAYPSLASLMLHLLLHAAGNMRANALRLIQLHDIALLAQRLKRGDWDELLTFRPSGRGLWWALPPLWLTSRYYTQAIPALVIERLDAECPWLLGKIARRRCITDVSWSNIRVHALPGIEWSQTPQEALRFLASRVWPSRYDRFELRHFAATHPGAAGVPWYGISHGARILRWLFSRPPRVQTLISVRAAFAEHSYDSGGSDPA